MKTILLMFISLFFCQTLNAQELKIAIPSDVYKDYLEFIGDRNPYELTSYTHEKSRRDVVEIILLLKAIRKGGLEMPVQIAQLDSYARIIAEVEKGNFAFSATTSWRSDIDENKFFISEETLKEGRFYAGLYAKLENKKFFQIKNKEDISNFKAVSNSAWSSDWKVLSSLSLKYLQDVKQWDQMVRLVNMERVDFLLAPFQNKSQFVLSYDGISLYPLEGFKVTLPGSRVFMISKKYPNAREIFDAFNKGLLELIKSGEVDRAYEESGFINKKVLNWKSLN